jgi:predicted ribonuclease YlaK
MIYHDWWGYLVVLWWKIMQLVTLSGTGGAQKVVYCLAAALQAQNCSK